MPETILIESEATKADDLLTTALERLKQQTLANPTTANIDDTIAKVEAPFRDFKHDLELLRQKKSVHKLPEEFQALDCDRLENMRLAYWQERRLVQQSTEASIDLKAVESLEYLSLMRLDLEYLRQQRRIEQNVTTMQGITNREDDNSMIACLDKLRRTPQQSSMDQSVLKSSALSLKRESRVNRDSRELGTLSNEIESFTSYYDVGGRDEPSDVIAHRKLSASIQQPQALASPRAEDTVDPVHAAESRHGNLSKRSLDAAIATSSSRGRPAAAKVVIPKIKSWEKSTTARAGQTSSPLASANQTAVPRARNLQDQSATLASTTPTVKMVPVENTALNFQNSQEQSHLIISVHSAQPDAKGSHVQSKPANLVQFAIPQLLGRREQSKWTAPVDLGILNSEGSRTQKNPTTPVSPGTPKSLGRREQSKWTTPVPLATPKALGLHAHEKPTTTSAQIPSSNTPKKHASPNASPSKMQTYQIKKKTDKKSQFSHSGQTRPSLPESWTTKSTTETRTESTKPQKISDVPTINLAKMVQKQTSTTPRNDEKTKMPGAKIESRLDGTSAPVEAGSRNAQESTTTKNQDANLPKKLSKSARKKANQKQNKAMQKELERQEAAAIEAAIASSREQAELITESEVAETLASLRIERLDPGSLRTSQEQEEYSRQLVDGFLACLADPDRGPPQIPLPLPREDIQALVSQGYAVFDWHYTELALPPPTFEAIIGILDQVLAAVVQIYPRLALSHFTHSLTRHYAETLLLSCVEALQELAEKDSHHNLQEQNLGNPFLEAKSSAAQSHDEEQSDSFPQIPAFLQPSARNPTIAAAERASAERQKAQNVDPAITS